MLESLESLNSYSPLYWLLNRDPQKWFIIIPTSLGVNPLPNSNSNLWSCDKRSETWPWLCSLPHPGRETKRETTGGKYPKGLQDAFLDHQTFLCEPLKTVKKSGCFYHERKQRISKNTNCWVWPVLAKKLFCSDATFWCASRKVEVRRQKEVGLQQHWRKAYI